MFRKPTFEEAAHAAEILTRYLGDAADLPNMPASLPFLRWAALEQLFAWVDVEAMALWGLPVNAVDDEEE
jgi:hypothetical protein